MTKLLNCFSIVTYPDPLQLHICSIGRKSYEKFHDLFEFGLLYNNKLLVTIHRGFRDRVKKTT